MRMKSLKIWFNKKLVDWEKAKIHVLTHSLHYGNAVFEGIRCYKTKKGPAVFRLDEHIKRLFYSAKVLKMKIDLSSKEIKEAILKTIKINKLNECYIRPIVFYGEKMGLNPEGAPLNIAIAVWPWPAYLGEKPIKVKVSKYIRIHPKSTICDAKISGHYLNSILASMEVKERGYDEALLLDYKGYIAEGAGENIFIVKNNQIFTPEKGNILAGITRDTVIKLAQDLDYKVTEKKIKLAELFSANEIFFTGTAVEISPIIRVNKILINKGREGEITKKIKEIYKKITRGEIKKYLKWLTFLNQ